MRGSASSLSVTERVARAVSGIGAIELALRLTLLDLLLRPVGNWALRPFILGLAVVGLLRSGWLAQELLSTFGQDLGRVSLVPADGGVFQVRLGEALLWCRVRDGGFPEAKELKRRVRDAFQPERDLGHIDR